MKLLVAGRHEVFEYLQTDKDSPGIVSPGQIVGKDGRDGSSKEVFLAGGIVQGKTDWLSNLNSLWSISLLCFDNPVMKVATNLRKLSGI